jgi:circadian clock protein KaiC
MVEEAGEYDLEGLFVRLAQAVDSIGANRVVLDSIESLFASLANEAILRSELRRLFRWLKDRKRAGWPRSAPTRLRNIMRCKS